MKYHLLVAAAVSASLAALPAIAQPRTLVEQTRAYLDAWAKGDRAAVLAMSEEDVAVYGSDLAEVVDGKAAVAAMLDNDQKLWGGAASIGPMQHVSLRQGPVFGSVYFDAGFAAGGQPPVPVRFALVWRRHGANWKLAQSVNVVPTQGQSAAQLLAKGK